MNQFQKSQAEKIRSCYPDSLEKSEGSRGGKVIGHDKQGKPIYESHESGQDKHSFKGINTEDLHHGSPESKGQTQKQISKLDDKDLHEFVDHHKGHQDKHWEKGSELAKERMQKDPKAQHYTEKEEHNNKELHSHLEAHEMAKKTLESRQDKFLKEQGATKVRPKNGGRYTDAAQKELQRGDIYSHGGETHRRDDLYSKLKQ